MRVRYTGGIAAVEVRLPDGGWLTVKRGESAEVPDELGAKLIERPDWSEVKTRPAKKKPAKQAPRRAAQPAPAEEQPAEETPARDEKGAE